MQNSENMSIVKEANEFSFEKGWSQVQNKDQKDVKRELMNAVNVLTNPAFRMRLKGRIVPKVPEAREIEAIFAKRGITEVWGEALTAVSVEQPSI